MKNEEIKETLKIIKMIKEIMEVDSSVAENIYRHLKQTDSENTNISEKLIK